MERGLARNVQLHSWAKEDTGGILSAVMRHEPGHDCDDIEWMGTDIEKKLCVYKVSLLRRHPSTLFLCAMHFRRYSSGIFIVD
jgi:hypothetical protein